MPAVNIDGSLLRGVLEFLSYMTLAVFAENVILARALGVTRLLKLVPDHKAQVWDYSLPFLLIMALSAPLGWAAHNLFFPWLRGHLPAGLPVAYSRALRYLTCAFLAAGVSWLLLGLLPRRQRQACRAQTTLAGSSTAVLGTLLICTNQNYTLPQSIAFGLGSGIGYVFIIFIVREGAAVCAARMFPRSSRGCPAP